MILRGLSIRSGYLPLEWGLVSPEALESLASSMFHLVLCKSANLVAQDAIDAET